MELLFEKTHWKRKNTKPRRALITVVRGYDTISAVTAQIIAGVPPINFEVEDRDRLYKKIL